MLNIKINTSRVKVIAFSARLRRSSFAQRHDHNEHSADVDAAAAADDDHEHDADYDDRRSALTYVVDSDTGC